MGRYRWSQYRLDPGWNPTTTSNQSGCCTKCAVRISIWLFQTVDGRPLRNHHMNVMFTRHGLKAGVRQVNPHRFRHTFATWAIRASARELDVQYLLGHSSPMMVRRYSATYDSEQAASAHATFSPAMQLAGGR